MSVESFPSETEEPGAPVAKSDASLPILGLLLFPEEGVA